MCTLVAYRRPFDGIELAVAAARDERWDRPSADVERLSDRPPVWGGRDLESGGTWLAVDADGLLVAVTNAALGARTRPGQRSRGLLALELARAGGPERAVAALRREDLGRYAAVNVLVASGSEMVVASNRPERRLLDGLEEVGLGNEPFGAASPRVEAVGELLRPGRGETAEEWARRAELVLGRHEPPVVCRHGGRGGTVSASVILLASDPGRTVWAQSDGSPCAGEFRRVELA